MRFRGKLTHQSVKVYALEKNENSVNQSRWGFILSMEREKFSSRLGFILISAGCAIGLGNVWRFPYIVGAYGGAAFVLIYLAFLLILGLPIVVMEFAVGRASKRSAALSFNMLEPKGTKWHLTRYAAMAGNYMLMMFYTTVAGWMIYYFIKMLRGDFTGLDSDAVAGEFTNMLGNPALMTGFMIFVVVLCFGICAQGLVAGVERITKVMMVCLLFLMMALAVHSMVLKGGAPGLEFYLKPDFGKMVDAGLGNSIFAAMGQSFFTLSIGIGALAIFGSYIGKERRLTGEAISITILDTLVAFMAGLIIFPACFAYGVEPTMSFAALSTVIAVFQNIISFATDLTGCSVKKAVAWNVIVVIILSLPCVFGFNIWSSFQPLGAGSNIQDLEDFILSDNLLPIGSLLYLLFCTSRYGWGFEKFLAEANEGAGVKFPRWARFYVSYILPLIVIFILVQGYIAKFF